MPLRTINDVAFEFRSTEGPLVTVRRGETVDIPEGPDLERGDKFGAFTAVAGVEPLPPEGTILPDILVEWTPQEFNRFVDAATADEITQRLYDVAPEDQPFVARQLIEAETTRKKVRKNLVTTLSGIADQAPAVEVVRDPKPVTEDLLARPVNEVLTYAAENPETVDELIDAETAKGESARKSLLEGLAKLKATEA